MSTAAPDRWSMLLDRWQARADSAPAAHMGPGALAAAATGGRELQKPHLDLIDDAYQRIAEGRLDKRGVIITMPPRHGKSQRATRWGPIWFLQRQPDKRVVVACHTQALADDHARWVRDTVESPPWVDGKTFNLGFRIRRTSKAVSRWDLDSWQGGMYAVGVGGPLTGRGADLLIIDDPVKSAADADSKVMRDRVWDWWESTASTRLEPSGKVIVIMTRWHEDDLAGRLLTREPDQWEQINLPALAEAEDQLGRAVGEPLWAERYDRDDLLHTRAHISPRWWAAQYQQRPSPPEGSVWRGEWITQNRVLIGAVPAMADIVVGVDPSGSDSDSAAECGIIVAGRGIDGDGYVIDDRSLRGTPREWANAVWHALLDHGASRVVLEDNYGKLMATDVLRSAWQAEVAPALAAKGRNRPMPHISPVNAQAGKRLRAEPIAVRYDLGQVHHVDDGSGHLSDVEAQMIGWTGSGDSPDRLDALVHALTALLEGQHEEGSQVVVPARWASSSRRR